MNRKLLHSGQVALIMVLIMTVISAVAVSVASRSTVETRIQEMNVENTEALLTAQAGLEESIAKNLPVSGNFGEGRQYQVTVGEVGSTGISTEKINPGEVFEVNLESALGVTGLKIYWKPVITGGAPALFISDVRSDQIIDYAYDTDGTGGFTRAVSGGALDGVNYNYSPPSPLSVSAGDSRLLRITVLGAAAFVGIEPIGGLLPPQSTTFRSVADVSSTAQSVVKYGIEYHESITDQLPSVFDYVLFSGGTINQ